MSKRSNKQILMACQMSFDGMENRAIANVLETTQVTVSKWRKSKIWKEFEEELMEAHKKQILETSLQFSGATFPVD